MSPAETDDSNVHGLITDACVAAECRGEGAGRAPIAAAERHLAARGVRRVRVCALADNRAAQRAYARAGYRPYEVVLEKVLDAPP
ncbi:MAG: GNAT family N-acetyltransferase [Alphaproteobacteria bacterium]|nr:GNAT family N-acetyltransferase [Alphaproteobacteria bacterium]